MSFQKETVAGKVRSGSKLLRDLVVVASFGLFSVQASAAVIEEFRSPIPVSMPLHVGLTSEPAGGQTCDHKLWVGLFTAGKLAYVSDPAQPWAIYDMSPASGPMNIRVDSKDNSAWVSAVGNYITNMKTSGEHTETSIPSAASMPMGVGEDAQGNIWFAEMWRDQITKRLPNGQVVEYKIPGKGRAGPTGLTVDKNGDVWFAESVSGKVSVYRTATGKFERYELPGLARPMGISYMPMQADQNVVWFTETLGNRIGSISLDGKKITLYKILTKASLPMMAMQDMYGNVWFTEMEGNQIGQLIPNPSAPESSQIIEHRIPTPVSMPMGLAIDDECKTVWFTETRGNQLGKLKY
ncbi:hypothetical protein RG903_10405 [Thermithiobacillus tepidarius DSM 3134]|uniref:Vgb family protein n=1 Tax=Thermithiobacillus tepidarius TaxID=929 RepID=UPI0004907861|nr:hypothetical protein [Thermithiobacillus tepidarius]